MIPSSVAVLLLLCGSLAAQQPFYTDDADVTGYRKFHMEFSNQFSWLQKSAFPNLRQNAGVFQLNYGLLNGVEIGFDYPLLVLFNSTTVAPQTPAGFGDANLTLKWNFRKESANSRWPALTLATAIETPTGDVRTQLGSGIADYGFNAVAQKSLGDKTVIRLNSGVIFSGNTLTGVVGLKAQGFVYTGGASATRQLSDTLLLGVEINGAAARNADLGKGAVQTQFGGKYALRKHLTLDVGILVGWLVGSPRVGAQIGFSLDF